MVSVWSQCDAGHLVCGACRGIHGQACDRAGTVMASPDVDVYVRSVRLPCTNAEFGCESCPVYYQAADHEHACHWAPCRCPDPACDASTSPARLLAHFAGRHSWPVTGVSYAKPHRIALPPPPRGLHFLVAKEDGRVFLVTSTLGGAASLVCLRANGDDAAVGAPRFRCTLWVEDVARVTFKVASSDLSGGYVAAAEQGMFLAAPPGLMRDAPGDGEMPDLMVRIDIDKVACAAVV
jgi:hypothetical protein